MKPILCLDFDGVCHSYISGWKGANVISDPPVEGLFEFLHEANEHFSIYIFSSRSGEPGGIQAMKTWFNEHGRLWAESKGLREGSYGVPLEYPTKKPSAFITIDDRGLLFTGKWPELTTLRAFRPWNKIPKEPPA